MSADNPNSIYSTRSLSHDAGQQRVKVVTQQEEVYTVEMWQLSRLRFYLQVPSVHVHTLGTKHRQSWPCCPLLWFVVSFSVTCKVVELGFCISYRIYLFILVDYNGNHFFTLLSFKSLQEKECMLNSVICCLVNNEIFHNKRRSSAIRGGEGVIKCMNNPSGYL